jgi:hypothetical protein
MVLKETNDGLIATYSAAFEKANYRPLHDLLTYENGWFVFRNMEGRVQRRVRRIQLQQMRAILCQRARFDEKGI